MGTFSNAKQDKKHFICTENVFSVTMKRKRRQAEKKAIDALVRLLIQRRVFNTLCEMGFAKENIGMVAHVDIADAVERLLAI